MTFETTTPPAPPARRCRPRWPFTLLAATLAGTAHAGIYGGTDESGTVVLSNFQTELANDLVVAPVPGPAPAAPPASAAPAAQERPAAPAAMPVPQRLLPLIDAAARRHGLPPALLAAVAATESGFNDRALSAKGAAGLMQLLPATARRFNVTDRYAAHQSLDGGAAYLRWLHQRFDGDLVRVLAAYNAGEGAVEAAGGVPPFDETRAYVPRVLSLLAAYAAVFAR